MVSLLLDYKHSCCFGDCFFVVTVSAVIIVLAVVVVVIVVAAAVVVVGVATAGLKMLVSF